jgi:chromate transporter
MNANSEGGAPDFQPRSRPSAPHLFLVFSGIGISSFGGGLPTWLHRSFVQRRGCISDREFATMLVLARLVPGVNVINLGVLIGNRLRGLTGALAAIMGLLIGPSLIAIGMAVIYSHISGSRWVAVLLSGTAAAAAGLLVAMGLSSTQRTPGLPRKIRLLERPTFSTLIIFGAVLILVGILRFPSIPVVLCVAPISVGLAFIQRDSQRGELNDRK